MKTGNILWQFIFVAGLVYCCSASPASAAMPDPVRFGIAVELGDQSAVKDWLDAGLSPDFMANRIGSGLMIAAWEGNVEMMELFFAHGAQINLSNRYDEQALQLAAWRGNLEAVKWLLDHGALLNRSGPRQRWGALHYAAFAGHGEIAKLLIERGAEINARAPNGSTVLMMAAREGHEDLARQLLESGADPKAVNESGESALTWAMRHEHLRIAQMVSSPAEFSQAAKAAPSSFGSPVRSTPAPSEIEAILLQIRLAQAAGKSTDALRNKLFSVVARFKQDSRKLTSSRKPGRSGKPKALVITARRGRGASAGRERAELVYAGKAPRGNPAETPARSLGASSGNNHEPEAPDEIMEILERLHRAQAAGKPVNNLRKALFEAAGLADKRPD